MENKETRIETVLISELKKRDIITVDDKRFVIEEILIGEYCKYFNFKDLSTSACHGLTFAILRSGDGLGFVLENDVPVHRELSKRLVVKDGALTTEWIKEEE